MVRIKLSWEEANRAYLMQSLQPIKQALAQKAQTTSFAIDNPVEFESEYFDSDRAILFALEGLSLTFELSTFERNLLLLCAGMELDPEFPVLCGLAQGDNQKNYPTFSLAYSILENPHWNAIVPHAPLRSFELIEIGRGGVLTLCPLKINERILHGILGLQYPDQRLIKIVEPLDNLTIAVDSHQQLATQLAQTWYMAKGKTNLPIIQLCGQHPQTNRSIAYSLCHQLGLNLYLLSLSTLEAHDLLLHQFLDLWQRECILTGSTLLVESFDFDSQQQQTKMVQQLMAKLEQPLIISSAERVVSPLRSVIQVDVHKPTSTEQIQLWGQMLGPYMLQLNGQVEKFVCQFNLDANDIQAACVSALTSNETIGEKTLAESLWDACRIQARPRLESLAQRINPMTQWDDLVLPETQKDTLRAIVAHVRQRAKVYETWGFAKKSDRGLGISALFSGPSGTGKTSAAEVLALELNLDLYRIDLSSVVSKYIGETEKNLRRVFDVAESGGGILLFDEADALFGKRSEVKDSHDRHANIEVSYLLQRMEAYRGLAILTTNLKNALDNAFMRRIRFVVQFSFPDVQQRAEIWRRAFPQDTPTEDIDPEKLAKLSVAGGNIRNIALNAAFLAAETGEPVRMKHLLIAARSEHSKLDKPLVDSQVKGWI